MFFSVHFNFSLKKKSLSSFRKNCVFIPSFWIRFSEEKCFRFLFQHLILSPFFEQCPFVFSPPFIFFSSFDFHEVRRRRRRPSVSKRNISCADASVNTDKKDHSPTREGWQDSRRSTSPRPTELWLQASPLHPPAQKYSTHAFPGTTFPGFHSFWLLPFPKLRSSHSRWAVHCCPRLRGEDSSSDDSANSGSDSDVTLHFTILQGRASPASIATLFLDPFSCFFFCRFFTAASFLFLNLLCFWPLGFSSSVFLFCRHLLLFDRFSLYVMNFYLLGLFFFMSFSCFPVVYLLVFPSWNHFSLSPKKSVSFMLVLSLPFSFCFDLSTKYLVSLLNFFLFPFFYSAYFLMSSFLAKKIKNRIKWEMAWCNGCPADEINDNGSNTDFTRQQRHRTRQWWRELPITQCNLRRKWKKWFSWVWFLLKKFKKELSKWVKEKQCFQLFGKNVFKQDIPFQKEWAIKQENNKDNSKLSVFLVIEWLVCDTDSPWVIHQWMLSIISICSLSPWLLSLRIPLLPQHVATSYPEGWATWSGEATGWNVHQDFRRHENSKENHVPQPQED